MTMEHGTSKPEIPRIARKHKKLQKVRYNSSVHPSEWTWPCQHIDFRLLAPRAVRKYTLVKSPALWLQYSSSRKLVQGLRSSCLLTLFHFALSFIEHFPLQALITWEIFTCMCLILCLPFLFSVVKACVFHIHSYSPCLMYEQRSMLYLLWT